MVWCFKSNSWGGNGLLWGKSEQPLSSLFDQCLPIEKDWLHPFKFSKSHMYRRVKQTGKNNVNSKLYCIAHIKNLINSICNIYKILLIRYFIYLYWKSLKSRAYFTLDNF